jgi:hypothetical protein
MAVDRAGRLKVVPKGQPGHCLIHIFVDFLQVKRP